MTLRRVLRLFAVSLAALLLAATVAFVARDSIAKKTANMALNETDVRVLSVSGSKIDKESVRVSSVVASVRDSTIFELRGLALPTNIGDAVVREISIETVDVSFHESDEVPLEIARNILAYLDLPTASPNMKIAIGKLDIPDLPAMEDIVWTSTEQRSTLTARVSPYNLLLTAPTDAANSKIELQIEHASLGRGFVGILSTDTNGNTLAFSGDVQIRLSALAPLLDALGVIPIKVKDISGEWRGTTIASVRIEPGAAIKIQTKLKLHTQFRSTYLVSEDSSAIFMSETISPIEFDTMLPDLEWTARSASAVLNANWESIRNQSISLSDVRCSSGVFCTLNIAGDIDSATVGGVTFSTASFSLPISAALSDVTIIGMGAGSYLSLNGAKIESAQLEKLCIFSVFDSQLKLEDTGWSLAAASTSLRLDGLRIADDMQASGDIELTDLHYSENDENSRMGLAFSSSPLAISVSGVRHPAISVSGHFGLTNSDVTSDIRIRSNDEAIDADLRIKSDTLAETSDLEIRSAAITFVDSSLSQQFDNWSYGFDIATGAARFGGAFSYDHKKALASGAGTLSVADISGAFDEIAFIGLNGNMAFSFDSEGNYSSSPTDFSLEFLDAGIQVQDIEGLAAIRSNGDEIDFQSLRMKSLGGRIEVDPFLFSFVAPTNTFVVRPEGLSLSKIAELGNLTSVEVDGSVSGHIPVSLNGSEVTMTGGTLHSDGDGGFLRYSSAFNSGAESSDQVASSQIDQVSQSLSNFEFSSLSSEVSYQDDGNLSLQMRLTGVNPDVDPTQPVILNLGVENNIPQLLRSLQATRTIEQILERRAAQ